MKNEDIILMIQFKYEALAPCLNEKSRRIWAATEAQALGRGGKSLLQRATGISRPTIDRGIRELKDKEFIKSKKQRNKGGGRKKLIEKNPDLLKALDELVDPTSRGDPMSPLKWTSKSTRKLADQLKSQKYNIEYKTVGTLLNSMDYSLQGNRKTKEGKSHPDRDAQFNYINETIKELHRNGQIAISVDTKKRKT